MVLVNKYLWALEELVHTICLEASIVRFMVGVILEEEMVYQDLLMKFLTLVGLGVWLEKVMLHKDLGLVVLVAQIYQ